MDARFLIPATHTTHFYHEECWIDISQIRQTHESLIGIYVVSEEKARRPPFLLHDFLFRSRFLASDLSGYLLTTNVFEVLQVVVNIIRTNSKRWVTGD